MAPVTASAVELTPNPVSGYAPLKTPETEQRSGAKRFGPAPWAQKHWYLGSLAQFLIFAAIFLYIFGQLAYAAPVYWIHLKPTMTKWWGKHSEFVRPGYLFLFCLLPFLVGLLALEFLRDFNVRRITSRYILKMAQILRRKPSMFGKVSWFSYGELLFLLFIIGGNVLVFYHSYMRRLHNAQASALKSKKKIKTDKYFDMAGNSLGFNCLFNFAFLFLPSTRNSAWMEFLNISYANGIKYHRWFGMSTVLTALAHCIAFYWMWIRQGKWVHKTLPCIHCSLKEDEEGWDRWLAVFGELALIVFLVISFSSVPYVRRNYFNAFYYIHQLFFLAVFFIALHWGGAIWFIFPSVMLYLINRFISTTNSFTAVQVTEFTSLSDEFVKIIITRSALHEGNYKVGQFVYLNVPSVSQLQWHPFTIASSPRTSATSLTLIVKSLGDWTHGLVEYCNECKQNNVLPTVYMDGYHGASLELYEDYSTVCLVAGGVGVTPLIAILDDIVTKLSRHEQPIQKVYFIFTFRELSLLEEIHPILLKIKELDPQETYFSLIFSLTREPAEAFLDQKIDHDRLHRVNYLTPTHYNSGVHRAFAQPLSSRVNKSLTYVVIFAVTVLLTVVLEYDGGKIEGHNEELWIVQNFVEIAVFFVCSLLVFAFVYVERTMQKKTIETTPAQKGPSDVVVPSTPNVYASDVHTFRDLIAQYNVSIGHRPDLLGMLREVHRSHQSFIASNPSSAKNTVGVFVSGPHSLKSSVEHAVADIGSSKFDIHEEEFEL